MKEKTLESVISLFALVANHRQGRGFSLITNVIEIFLDSLFSKQTVETAIERFQLKLQHYDALRNKLNTHWEVFFWSEIEAKCYIISREVPIAQRLLLLTYIMDFLPILFKVNPKDCFSDDPTGLFGIFRKLASNLGIAEPELLDSWAFISLNHDKLSGNHAALIIAGNQNLTLPSIFAIHEDNLDGILFFLHLPQLNAILFQVYGNAHFEMNGRQIFKRRTYLLDPGAVIAADDIKYFFYNDILKALCPSNDINSLTLQANNLQYIYPGSDQGIHELHCWVQSGDLMAIMGGSGSGKTTLLNLLAGLQKPHVGAVTLNGADVFLMQNSVRKFIGYVPQDDALNDDLSVFDNLFFAAALALGDLSHQQRLLRIQQVLSDLDLWDFRNLKVGSPLQKVISGGQRKRLNIALELIRNPGILFLDEPTSGLSSADAENLLTILKRFAMQGRIVIINIHQPSSAIYKLFDKLLFLDKGGRPVYFGSALRVISYLKKGLALVDAHQGQCPACGQLNPEEIFSLVQKHKISNDPRLAQKRLIDPQRWHRRFIRLHHACDNTPPHSIPLPQSLSRLPGRCRQAALYSIRNLKTKFSDSVSFALSFIFPALLALILAFFTKHIPLNAHAYSFADNRNIPAFLFMSVLVAIFIGLISSAQDIIRDRATLKREAFLSLSYSAYIFSKFVYLLCLSAIQSLIFWTIAVVALKFPNFSPTAFIILWSANLTAASLGLLLSSIFKSLAAIYLAVPLVIIPQIMLAGAVIPFDHLNPLFDNNKRAPLVAQAAISRWAYEAIAIDISLNNKYANLFFNIEQQYYDAFYVQSFLIPDIENNFFENNHSSDLVIYKNHPKFLLFSNAIYKLAHYNYMFDLSLFENKIEGYNLLALLDSCNLIAQNRINRQNEIKDSIINLLGEDNLISLKNTNLNKRLLEAVARHDEPVKIKITPNRFVRKFAPIYDIPKNNHDLEQFYSPFCFFGNNLIYTPWFNILICMAFSFATLLILRINKIKY